MAFGSDYKTVRIGKWNVRLSDLAFLAVFAALAAYFIINAPYGITQTDESVYQYYCYRLVQGDKLFADDWNFSNMFTVFLYLPYRLFYTLSGGTEGIVMAFRYLYTGLKLVSFCLVYICLRQYGFWAILAGGVFVGTDIFGLKTVSYYTVCIYALLLTGLLLFIKKEPKPVHRIAAGFLFSCAVVAEPAVAVVWFAYGALTLLRMLLAKKGKTALSDYDFILSPRVWFHIFYGICIGAAVFLASCALFFTGTDLRAIMNGVVQMLQTANDETAEGISYLTIRAYKPMLFAYFYNRVFSAAFVLVFVFGVCLHRWTKRFEKPVFILLSVLFAAMSVSMILKPAGLTGGADGECAGHALLLCVLAFACYVFTSAEYKNKKTFAFLLLSFAASLLVDATSNVTFGCILLAGAVPAVLLLRDYVRSQQTVFRTCPAEKKAGKKAPVRSGGPAKAFSVFLCVLVAFVSLYEVWHYVYMGRLHETEQILVASNEPLDTVILNGALKGVVTTASLAEEYAGVLSDARRIREIGGNELYVIDYAPSVYLDAQLSVCGPWLHFFWDDWQGETLWWEGHPERKPSVFYIPYQTLCHIDFGDRSPAEKLEYLRTRAALTVEEGAKGYIVTAEQWYE